MLKPMQAVSRTRKVAADLGVEIADVAMLPAYQLSRAEAAKQARALFPRLDRLEALYGNTGVGTRYTSQALEWSYAPHNWVDRSKAGKE